MDQLMLERDWNEIKGKLRHRWEQLTDDDLPLIRSDLEQFIGTVQRKTGEAREAIAQYLHDLSGGASAAIGSAAGSISHQAHHASDVVQHSAHRAADQVRAGYDEAERFVRDRPGTSLAVCFGAGIALGIFVALSLRNR